MFTVQQFRTAHPEFNDPESFTDAEINLWARAASALLSIDRWGTAIDIGTALFVAHHLTVGRNASLGGAVSGPMTSSTVDKVSATYDTSAITVTDAGFWNASVYGVRLYQLMRLMGAGGIQISGGWLL